MAIMLVRFIKQLGYTMIKHWKRFFAIFNIVITCALLCGLMNFATKQFTMNVLYGSACFVVISVVVFFLHEIFGGNKYHDLIFDIQFITCIPIGILWIAVMIKLPHL